MNSAMGKLLDRAERAGAALLICDEQDRIVRVNERHTKVYHFMDYSQLPKFEDFQWQAVQNGKMADTRVYRDPGSWIRTCAQYREICHYSQFLAHHTDGRIFLVYYEKLHDIKTWWYQIRIDITKNVKARLRQDGLLSHPKHWNENFTPLVHGAGSPITNFLEAMSTAAGLITTRGKLLDANRALSALLNGGDGLRLVDGRVTARAWSEQVEFSKRLERFFGAAGQRRVSLRVSRLDSTEAYFLTVTPLLDQGREMWDGGHIGVLTVANPSAMPAIDISLLVTFFEITPAEAEVAEALGRGQSTAIIAESRGVQINTVHAHIKSIMRKTGYLGQADIARRVVDIARIFGTQ
jgi:DNA-binding CsgD family transcriptional regulator